MKKNYKNITVILTLYKTPKNKLDNLKNYKNYKIIVFDQKNDHSTKIYLKKKLNLNVSYYSSNKNIGLSKASNFLLSKVKTKFCLFTQPDIIIKDDSIQKLHNVINIKKDLIFVSPNHQNVKLKKIKKMNFIIKKKINFSCILCNVKELNKIGFFDEDFFLYWEDVFLEKKINSSNYKMAVVTNAFVKHDSSQSSEKNFKIDFIRYSNFIYGELVYEFKLNKLRFLKVFRKLFQNIFLFIFNILIFQLKEAFKNIALINGILKFAFFYLRKNNS